MRRDDWKQNHPCWILLCLLFAMVFFPGDIFGGRSAHAQGGPEPAELTLFLPLTMNGSPTSESYPVWLKYLNDYRAQSGLPGVSENTGWSQGGGNHARYSVKNNILIHTEDAENPWYTLDGQQAAESSNLMGSSDVYASDQQAIDAWMQAPFHALGILDPGLGEVGYGSYREADGGLQMSATLDVLRGLGDISPEIRFPLMWPGNGTTVSLTQYTSEHPDPLTSCPGYTAPNGLPVILQLGAGQVTPLVASHTFSSGGASLEHCIFTETTYVNPDVTDQELGRAILNDRDAVVLIPHDPLIPGSTYTVAISVNGNLYTWSFQTAESSSTGQQILPGDIDSAHFVHPSLYKSTE